MSYGPLPSLEEEKLVSVKVLYEAYSTEQNEIEFAAIDAVIKRWMSILTKEYIAEKIKQAHTGKDEYAVLIDERLPHSTTHQSSDVLFHNVYPPYTVSVSQHIKTVLDTNGVFIVYGVEEFRRATLTLYWGSGTYKAFLIAMKPCIAGCFCTGLCCCLCWPCWH